MSFPYYGTLCLWCPVRLALLAFPKEMQNPYCSDKLLMWVVTMSCFCNGKIFVVYNSLFVVVCCCWCYLSWYCKLQNTIYLHKQMPQMGRHQESLLRVLPLQEVRRHGSGVFNKYYTQRCAGPLNSHTFKNRFKEYSCPFSYQKIIVSHPQIYYYYYYCHYFL